MSEHRTKGGNGSHWEGCYHSHADCADALIERQAQEIAAYAEAWLSMARAVAQDGDFVLREKWNDLEAERRAKAGRRG